MRIFFSGVLAHRQKVGLKYTDPVDQMLTYWDQKNGSTKKFRQMMKTRRKKRNGNISSDNEI